MRLLLVDDDAGFRELLRTTFEAVEVDVDEAASAGEAEARIAAVRPDVIVLDVGMPGMDGLAFCRVAVEDHGGRIAVASVEGQGSTFSIWLPVEPPTVGKA